MFFVFSLLVDAVWAIVIAWKTWFSPDYEKLAPWEHGLHITTVSMVGANAVLKIISIILSFLFDNKVKQSFSDTYTQTMRNFSKGSAY